LSAVISGAPAAATAPAPAEPRPCLIVNARSFRASRRSLAARAAQLAREYGADVMQCGQPSEIEAALDRLRARRQQRIFVLAGDGTVQAIVEHLSRLSGPEPLPQLLVLGGGRTNLIAGDLGGRGAVLKKLESALKRWRSGVSFEVDDRHTLRIEQAPAAPRHGFFVAAGMIDTIIRECHRGRETARPGALRRGHLSTPLSLARLALLSFAGRPLPFADLAVQADGSEALPGSARLLIATTLQRRQGLLDPYADRGEGPLRITVIAAGARGLWHRLPRVVAGLFSERMNARRGYLSGRHERVQVLGLARYTLDGEEFDCDPARPVVIRAGMRVSFLKP
jgi:hypothetical protein